MSSEMLSGPDLGAGYLHQLTVDNDRGEESFTFHAQEGGQDAGGPTLGPLEPLGFVLVDGMCQYGGRRCWHRRFLLPRAESGPVRRAYNRWRFTLAPLLEQRTGRRHPPLEATLTELLDKLGPPLESEGIDWYIGGSTSAWLQGAGISPADIDVGTTPEGVHCIGELLAEYVTEPVAPTDWGASGRVLGGRAFVGTLVDGVRVEWAVPQDPSSARGSHREWSSPLAGEDRVPALLGKRIVPATRLEFALVRSAELGRRDRIDAIATVVRSQGVELRLLESLLADGTVSAENLAYLRSRIAA